MQKIAILYDASQAVLSTFALDEVLNQILQIARDYFRLKNSAIMLLDPKTQTLRVRAYLGDPSQATEKPIGVGDGIAGTAVKLKRPIYAPDVTKDPRYLQNFQVDQVAVVLFDQGFLCISRFHGRLTSRLNQGERIPDGAGLCARALATAEPVVENNVREVPGYLPGFEEAESEACLPLISFGEALGVLVLDSAKPGAFDEGDVQALQAVADICGNA